VQKSIKKIYDFKSLFNRCFRREKNVCEVMHFWLRGKKIVTLLTGGRCQEGDKKQSRGLLALPCW
jgi:hypothetical protein